jgi:hypothetical protein
MEYIVSRIVDFLIAIGAASLIALSLGFFAHYVFGVSRLDIRTAALMGAAIFAVLMAPVWFGKKPK